MHAFVLSRRDFREFDQTISLYTKERGKVEALARGVKKITSKNGAALEPFSFVEVEIIPGKEIDHIAKVQLLDLFSPIRQNLQKITIAGYVVGVVDKSISGGEKDERVYGLIEGFLYFLASSKRPLQVLVPSFLMKLYSLLGFEPVLDQCILCGKHMGVVSHTAFDLSGGGVVCGDCIQVKKIPPEQIVSVSIDTLAALRELVYGRWEEVGAMRVAKGVESMLGELTYRFVVYHSNQKIGDWRKIVDKVY